MNFKWRHIYLFGRNLLCLKASHVRLFPFIRERAFGNINELHLSNINLIKSQKTFEFEWTIWL